MGLNKIRSARRIQIGTRLTIPGDGGAIGGHGSTGTGADGRRVYTVKSGDTLYDIAKAERLTVAKIQQWNGLGERSRIHVGQRLYLSLPGASVPTEQPPASTGKKRVHVVRAGEYPARIARRYGADLDDFLRWNKLSKTSTIRVGDNLVVYTNGPDEADEDKAAGSDASTASRPETTQPAGTTKIVHKVVNGDNPSVIAANYGVRTTDFLAWNGLTARSILHIGEEYVVYRAPEADRKVLPSREGAAAATETPPAQAAEAQDQASPEAAAGEKTVHVVATGQNPTTIARRYGVRVSQLFEWNGWKRAPVLHVGDEVVVYVEKE